MKITVGATSGRLADSFELRGVEVRVPQGPVTISIRTVRLAWRPARLLAWFLAIDRLDLDEVVVNDGRPETNEPLSLKWPRISGLPASLQGSIGRFTARGVRYDRSGQARFSMDRLSCRIAWHHGMATVGDLVFAGPYLSGTGACEAGFFAPLLKADLALALPGRLGGIDRLDVSADLSPSHAIAREEMAGRASLAATMPSGERIGTSGHLAVSPREITFRDVLLTDAQIAGSVAAEGGLLFAEGGPQLRIRIRMRDARRRSGAGSGIGLTGEVEAAGGIGAYKGSFSLAGRPAQGKGDPWQAGNAAGLFTGNGEHLSLTVTRAGWLGGRVAGDIEAGWKQHLRLVSHLRGRDLDPAYLSREWSGRINVDADADVTRSADGVFSGLISASLPKSTLRGRPLAGKVRVALLPDLFRLDRLDLHGKGFAITASGVLQEKVTFNVSVSDLSGLIPAAGGRLDGGGWVRWKGGAPTGSVEGRGGGVRIGDTRIEHLVFATRLGGGTQGEIGADIEARGVSHGWVKADRLDLHVSGRRDSHTASIGLSRGQANLHLVLRGGLRDREWQGAITRFYGSDPWGPWKLGEPAALTVSSGRLVVRHLNMASERGETFGADVDLFFTPLHGTLVAAWQRIALARIQPFLGKGKAEGTLTGRATVQLPVGGRRVVDAQVVAEGTYREKGLLLPLKGQATVTWDERGLASQWALATEGGGKATGAITAAGPPDFRLPPKASLRASWEGVDMALLHGLLPRMLIVKGRIEGQVDGDLLPGGVVAMTGKSEITGGQMEWAAANGSVRAAIQKGSARFTWAGGALRGELGLSLATYGTIKGTFSLPLPARLPPAFTPSGPLALAFSGEVREQGLISAVLPGLMQETKGIMTVDVRGSGTWETPELAGSAVLKDAGAFFPGAGIRLSRLGAEATLAGETLHVSRIRAESGGGWIEASGDARLQKGQLRYEGTLKGENFQALNLPDLRVYASPGITFHGDTRLFSARGQITIPQLALYGVEDNVVRASPDVVVIETGKTKKGPSSLDLDIAVRVILGEKVHIATSGFDARLTGSLDVTMTSLDKINGHGTLKAVEGGYKAYGIRLAITRGNIIFNGPIEQPALDILAVRKTEDVTAGVEVSGTARNPVVTLYANHPMTDADKLAYIVMGHRLATADSSQSSLFTGTSDVFQGGATPTMTSEARRRLGMEGPPGTMPQEATASSAVGYGRYLIPGFYVGVGRSLLTGENLVTLRYKLSKSWEVQSMVGGATATGMDLFYRIEFD